MKSEPALEQAKLVFPTQNYHRMPNSLTSDVLKTLSRTEILVLLYLIRHLWGFGEQEAVEPKRISHDEFIHGRMQKGGIRMDSGTGVSRRSLISAIHSLIERGLIACEIDDSDKARIKRYYRIDAVNQTCDNCTSGVQKLDPDVQNGTRPGSKKQYAEVQKLPLDVQNFHPDHKKETKKETNTVATSTSPADSSKLATVRKNSIPKKQSAKMEITRWDERAADHFAMTLEKAGVEFKRTKRWNDDFRKLRNDWGKDKVRLVLEWYRDVIKTRYAPEVYSTRALRDKFQEKLLDKAKEWKNPRKGNTIVNGIQLLTAKDAEKIHETEGNIGYCHDLVIHPDWYVDDFYADPSAHYQLMADIINESIRADYGNAVSWRRHLREFGVGYLVKKHEG